MQALRYRAVSAALRTRVASAAWPGHGAGGRTVGLARCFTKRSRAGSGLVAITAAAGSLVLFAAPAMAANGPANVGCLPGSSCFISIAWHVTYGGSTGGSNGVVIKPPPCIGLIFGNAHTGSKAIINILSNNTAPVAQPSLPPPASPTASPAATASGAGPAPSASATGSPAVATVTPSAAASTTPPPPSLDKQERQILKQAEQLVSTNPMAHGEWYQVNGNPNATAAAQQKCSKLPPYIWVPGAANVLRVDGLNIPTVTLAGLAYSQLDTAKLGKAILDPQRTNDTNLPTFVQVPMVPPPTGALSVTASGDPYVWTSAQTPAGNAATVWAWVTGLTINPGTANATTFDNSRCSIAHLSTGGHTYLLGSRYSPAAMAQVGAGQTIDCGVTYTAPGTYSLTASITWKACWEPGLPTTDGPPAHGCKPVPGAANLAPSTTPSSQVKVREIQSVNG